MTNKTPAQLLREFIDRIANPTEKLDESAADKNAAPMIGPFGSMSERQLHELEGIKERNPALYEKMRNWE